MRPIAVEPKRTRKYTMLRAYNDPMDVEANAGFPSPAAPERWVGERVVWLRRWLPVAIALTVVLHQAWSARAYEGWSSSARFAAGMVFYGIVGPAVTWWTLDWIARSIAAREALTVANHELTQLDALKDEFVRLVSHELRAPLTNINASVELLIGQADDVGQRRKLEIIGHEASRLTRLVQSVLDVSRMQAGRLELLPAPVATAHLCAEAVRRFADADHPCHIEVKAEISLRQLGAYGVLGFPLAFIALPLYVHVPQLYADSVGLSLGLVGALLLLIRFADAVIDPWLGRFSDKVGNRRRLIALALPLMTLGLIAVLNPPQTGGAVWMVLTLMVTFIGYSLAMINYHAWGAELGETPSQRIRVTATRESLSLCGVVVAAALPSLLAPDAATALQ